MKKQKRALHLPLMQWIPAVTPRYHSPLHLAPFVEMLERATREAVRGLASVTPRHGKSDTVDHAIARMLREDPSRRIGFATYAARASEKRGRRIREIYIRAGGAVADDASSRADWRTGVDDGGLWSTSVGGPVTGEGFDVFICDDLVKDRVHAESGVEREKLGEWFRDVAFTRLEPGGSMIVVGARWTPVDLIGVLAAEGWEQITLPAIDGDGNALWPARYTAAQLARIRETVGEYGWASLYQGSPFARGGTLFQDVCFYEALPTSEPMVIRIGVDFAYTKKTKADYSVALVLGECAGRFYVLDVIRQQVIAPDFKRTLDGLAVRYPGVRPFAFVGGTEKGVVDMMNAQGGIQIETLPATQDKFLRAQPVSAKWNAGHVLLPKQAAWLDAFVAEVVGFTGADARDDQVDALAGAYERAQVGAQRRAQDDADDRKFIRFVGGAALAGGPAFGPAAKDMIEQLAGYHMTDAKRRDMAGALSVGMTVDEAELSPRHRIALAQQRTREENIRAGRPANGLTANDEANWNRVVPPTAVNKKEEK